MKSIMDLFEKLEDAATAEQKFQEDISRKIGLDENEFDRHLKELAELYPTEIEGIALTINRLLKPLQSIVSEAAHISWMLPESLADFFVKSITVNLRRAAATIEESHRQHLEGLKKKKGKK